MAITTKSLPDQIPPQASPFVYDDGTGELRLEIHWYLFLYHMWTVFSSSQGAFVLAQDVLLQDPSSGGTSGGVTAVTGTLPIVSSGGATPDISLTAGVTAGDLLTWTGTAWVSAAPPAVSLADWQESASTTGVNSGIGVSAWTPKITGAPTDYNAAIVPIGTGSFMLAKPDGTNVGGNQRGQNSFDGQISRNAATKVASGDFSAQFGVNNTTSAANSFTDGTGNQNDALTTFCFGADSNLDAAMQYGGAIGRNAKGRGITSHFIHGGGLINVVGDNQYERMIQGARNTGTYPVLTSGAGAVSTANSLTCPNESVINFMCQVAGYQSSSNQFSCTIFGAFYRSGGTVAFLAPVTVIGPWQIGAAGWSATATLDATNFSLYISVTNPTGGGFAEWTVVTHAALCRS